MVYKDGSIYEGEWKDNMKHGKGTMNLCTGDIYKATWLYDRINGRGIYINEEGQSCDVVWYNDVMVPLPD